MCQETVRLCARSGRFLATARSPWNVISSQCRSAVFFLSGAISLFLFSIFPNPEVWRTTFWEEVFSIYFRKWSESGRNSFTDCFVLWKFHQCSEFMEHRLRTRGLQLCKEHWSLPGSHPSGCMPGVNWFTLNDLKLSIMQCHKNCIYIAFWGMLYGIWACLLWIFVKIHFIFFA